jgi:hypothetical protein
LTELINYWQRQIERDLSPFADPGTQLVVDVAGSAINVSWTQRRKPHEASFRISKSGDGVTVAFQGQQFTYKQFYSIEAMGDLLGLAKMILQAQKQTIYIETSATTDNDSGSSSGQTQEPATTLIRRIISQETDGTNLVMVTGEAGAGKTSALKQLVRLTADDYLLKQSEFLFLYIDAQGRALARFSEALATELQDLRVNLTYHGISTLARLGVLIPVIDGFDELIGVGGYDDAFSSISSFIEELDGVGSVLASARSTYYEHEFLSRANRVSSLGSQAWQLRSIAVKAWGDPERDAYVSKKAETSGLSEADRNFVAQSVRKVFAGENEALSRKPLFVARTVDALLTGADLSGDGALLDRLVNVFLSRERTEKLLGRSGKPLVSSQQLAGLYAELAEEMWNQGTRELDKNSARDLAVLALLDAELVATEKQVVAERMPSLAFLQKGERNGSVAFEHEIFFGYFLARSLVKNVLGQSTGVALLLSRSVLPDTLAEAAAKVIAREDGVSLGTITGILCRAAATKSLKQSQAQENAALLVAALLKEMKDVTGKVENLHLHDLNFPGASLRDLQLHRCQFTRIEFRRTELCSTVFSACNSSECRFYSARIDEHTRLDIGGDLDLSSFTGLELLDDLSRVRQLYEPGEIKVELAKRGFPAAQEADDNELRKIDENVVELVEKFARAFQKRNPVCVDEDFLKGLFGQQDWPAIQKLLVGTHLVREETRSAHGPKRTFLRRLVSYQDIPAGIRRDAKVPIEIHQFWDAMEKKFPATERLRSKPTT